MRVVGIEIVLASLLLAIVGVGALVALSALHATEYDHAACRAGVVTGRHVPAILNPARYIGACEPGGVDWTAPWAADPPN